MDNYTFECSYPDDVGRFLVFLEKRGAHFISVALRSTSAYNKVYVVTYSHLEPLEIEVKT